MANEEHLARLNQGIWAWDDWRDDHPEIVPDLRGATLAGRDLTLLRLDSVDLAGADLREVNLFEGYLPGANLTGATLTDADLRRANLTVAVLRKAFLPRADLREAKLAGANLHRAFLPWANLREADLRVATVTGAILSRADLARADLRGADLTGTDLVEAQLVRTDLRQAALVGCKIYGISAWGVQLKEAIQTDLIVTPADEDESAMLTADSLEVAQFLYLLLHNEKIREIIDTITSKAVLILGRFTRERKAVLDAIREELRRYNYLPIMFDFQKPEGRNYIETVSTLAHMARFVIADITDAKVVLQELERIVPNLPSVPVQPIVQSNTDISAVIIDFVGHLNFLEQLHPYRDIADVKANLHSKIIQPAEAQLTEIHAKRLQFLEQVRQITHR